MTEPSLPGSPLILSSAMFSSLMSNSGACACIAAQWNRNDGMTMRCGLRSKNATGSDCKLCHIKIAPLMRRAPPRTQKAHHEGEVPGVRVLVDPRLGLLVLDLLRGLEQLLRSTRGDEEWIERGAIETC